MLRVTTPEELIAAVPHVLGFQPTESIVLVSATPDLPCARVDMPLTTRDEEQVVAALQTGFERYARPGVAVLAVCVSEDRAAAERAIKVVSAGLDDVGIATTTAVWSDGSRWSDLETGVEGVVGREVATRFAADSVFAGRSRPVSSREEVALSLAGDPQPVAGAIEAVTRSMSDRDIRKEREWARGRVREFLRDETRLSDGSAARMLLAANDPATRDSLVLDVSRHNAVGHLALWSDLVRRAPEEVRTSPAVLLALSSWLAGDGARAWCALDTIPPQHASGLPTLVATVLRHGVHPREWEQITGPNESWSPLPLRAGLKTDAPAMGSTLQSQRSDRGEPPRTGR